MKDLKAGFKEFKKDSTKNGITIPNSEFKAGKKDFEKAGMLGIHGVVIPKWDGNVKKLLQSLLVPKF